MHRKVYLYSLLSLVLVLANCGYSAAQSRKPIQIIEGHKQFADEVKKSDIVLLHEGLPHPSFEGDLLKAELKKQKTNMIGGFPFYQARPALKPEDATALMNLLANPTSLRPLPVGVVKQCGGFHPDYCIDWQVGKKVYRCLVCFGCEEIKVLVQEKALFYCELTPEVAGKVEEILGKYRKSRPGK